MANIKITELTELTAVDVASADVLPIVDVDLNITKKIRFDNLTKVAINTTPVTGGTTDYLFKVNGDGTIGQVDPATVGGVTVGTTVFTSGTTGSMLFIGASSVVEQDNANYFVDNTNKTVGFGTTRTGAISGTNPRLRVKGSGNASGTSSFEVQNVDAASLFLVRDDGLINLGSAGSFTNSTGQLALSTSGSAAGLLLGGDALLYRSAADILRTPDSLLVDSRVGIGDTISSTRRLYIYNPTAGDYGIYAASDGANTTTGAFINSGSGANVALIVNSFNGTSNQALLVSNGDISFNTGTGTKIATATNEKFAFWNKTPIVQPTTAIAGAALVSNGGTTITSTDTFGGYTLQQLAAIIINTGLGA